MDAKLILKERTALETAFVELVIWEIPRKLPGSDHHYKYRMALVSNGVCVIRYDNEAGKGDHRHIGGREEPYSFHGLEALIADFHGSVKEFLK